MIRLAADDAAESDWQAWLAGDRADAARKAWDESQHPREPAGSDRGGEFTAGGGSGGDARSASDAFARALPEAQNIDFPTADARPHVLAFADGVADTLDALDFPGRVPVIPRERITSVREMVSLRASRATWYSRSGELQINSRPSDYAAPPGELPRNMSRDAYETAVHEMGHVFHDYVRDIDLKTIEVPPDPRHPARFPSLWSDASYDTLDYVSAWLARPKPDEPREAAPRHAGVSLYATKNANESFAETFAAMMTNRAADHPAVTAMRYLLTKLGAMPIKPLPARRRS